MIDLNANRPSAMTACAILVFIMSIERLFGAEDAPPHLDSQPTFHIQKATSLVEIVSYLQSTDASTRETALRQWKTFPINLDNLDTAKKLRTSSDWAVKQYAVRRTDDIMYLKYDKRSRNIVLGEMEAASSVEALLKYLYTPEEYDPIIRFALQRWERLPPRKEDKTRIEMLMTNTNPNVAYVAVAKYGEHFRDADDMRKLGVLGCHTSTSTSVKIQIVKVLSQARNETSEQCIGLILENALRQQPKGDLKYAYRVPEFYAVAMAAIEALAQSQSEEANRLLEKLAQDDSIYKNLRQTASQSVRGNE